MKKCRFIGIVLTFVFAFGLVTISSSAGAPDYDSELPVKNVWFQATPSVLWLGDPASTTTLEVHIAGRKDVKRVWMTGLGSSELYGRRELFDDGTHGDKTPGDDVFTLANVTLTCEMPDTGYNLWWGYVRAELDNGTRLGNEYGNIVALVDPEYKDAFPAVDLGNGLSATPYAFFIQDSGHEVVDGYPVSSVYCGTEFPEAFKKLYTVFPDVFDFGLIMPGMQIFNPENFRENVPYNVGVSSDVEHIGRPIFDNTMKYGSSGRLKSVTYESFGDIHIISHELCHNWGVSIGKELGLLDESGVHWNDMVDIQGQMRGGYAYGGGLGYFAYNGDGTWRIKSINTVEPYSPLELYLMGLIPSSEVPDVHILKNPDLSYPEYITAESCKTITAQQIVESAGGERIPSWAESQKDFNMAFIVTQDLPYNDAAYAYFSLLSQKVMTRESPNSSIPYMAPFYWATGGRATLNTKLTDYGVVDFPATSPSPTESTASEPPPADTPAPKPALSPEPVASTAPEPPAVPVKAAGNVLTVPVLIITGVLAAAVAALLITLAMKRKGGRK